MRFIDLFAGLGGFHQALASQGHECVFASEIDPDLAALYEKNFGIRPFGDIREFHEQVPEHDILCAGFPCQPFSKAGDQLGFDCPQWGDLFDYVILVLERCRPRFLFIENVPNLMRHNQGRTWKAVCNRLAACGYDIASTRMSPHMLGVPQIRERALLVGDRMGLEGFAWPKQTHSKAEIDISSVLDTNPADARQLGPRFIQYLEAWQDLIAALPYDRPLPSFPIWAMEFGATYPFEDRSPFAHAFKLGKFKGALGVTLKGKTPDEIEGLLPVYARDRVEDFPEWKKGFIRKNRQFYDENKVVIDAWMPKIQSFSPSFQKLEWNWKDGPRDIWQTIIQFRASGIRAKRPNVAPSLVALTTSQVPVIASQRRYMTMRECARLQSMGDLPYLPTGQGPAYRALGNAVNVTVMSAVARALLSRDPTINLPLPSQKGSKKRHPTLLSVTA